jgi:hypothetical protein
MKKAKKTKPDELVTLKVDKLTHKRIKDYCTENNYWMHLFVENVMNDYLDKNNKVN